MENLLHIGQWQGFFTYGPEYGEMIAGHEAEFRLFIEEYSQGQFKGRIIDWEGFGANGEVADVKGFIKDDLISFTKKYPHFVVFDQWGNNEVHADIPGHVVVYEGRFDIASNSFIGTWEIIVDVEHRTDLSIEELNTGTWRMRREG